MDLGSALNAFFSAPTYGLPLAIAVGVTVALGRWGYSRSASLPSTSPRTHPEWWDQRPDVVACVALEEGRHFLPLYGLWLRLGAVANDRFQVRLDRPAELKRWDATRPLPSPLTPRGLVRDFMRAYYSTYFAETPGWLALQWRWWRRRQERRASQDFARVVAELGVALAALEAR